MQFDQPAHLNMKVAETETRAEAELETKHEVEAGNHLVTHLVCFV